MEPHAKNPRLECWDPIGINKNGARLISPLAIVGAVGAAAAAIAAVAYATTKRGDYR
jgi:hypothetical protein